MTRLEHAKLYPAGGFDSAASANAWISGVEKFHLGDGTVFWSEARGEKFAVVQGLPSDRPK